MFVNAHPGKPFESLMQRFDRGMEASGILRDLRKHQRFQSAHELRLAKIRTAMRRRRKAAERGTYPVERGPRISTVRRSDSNRRTLRYRYGAAATRT